MDASAAGKGDTAAGVFSPPPPASFVSAVYKADVMLTTYEMVQADRGVLSRVPWSCLVVDEAHRLRNCGGRAARDLRSMDFAGRVVLLTGDATAERHRRTLVAAKLRGSAQVRVQ